MAEKKTETEKKDDGKVEVFVPRGNRNDEATLFVSVNGKNYFIPKGKTSRVPQCVADEIERAEYAQRRLDKTMDELVSKSKV